MLFCFIGITKTKTHPSPHLENFNDKRRFATIKESQCGEGLGEGAHTRTISSNDQ